VTSVWWEGATFYQVYVPSFADADGDGVGDIHGVRERLGYLELLGVDALWLTLEPTTPIDVGAFDQLVSEAHAEGIKVTIDLPTYHDVEPELRFWLDHGVDGFRVDDRGVPDTHRLVRQVLDEYPGTMAIGEFWPTDDTYPRPYELHLGVNFRLMLAAFEAVTLRTSIDASLDAAAMASVPPTWTLSNHEAVRAPTRYGDGSLGTQRARAMAMVEFGLPGVVYLYNGEELGLPDLDDSRVPLPWEGTEPPFGFSQHKPWLPMPPDWAKLTVERQLEDADSTLSLYRQAIELRRTHPAFRGVELEWYGAPAGCFAYRRKGSGLVCVLNAADTPVPLPSGELLLASGPLADHHLPPNTAAWLV
jgi:alpha-glucosidase